MLVTTRRGKVLPNPEIKYKHNSMFEDKKNEKMIMAEMPDHKEFSDKLHKEIMNAPSSRYRNHSGLNFFLPEPLLTRQQEAHLFRKFNYCLFRAKHHFNKFGKNSRGFKRWYKLAIEARKLIAQCNMRLAYTLAHQFKTRAPELGEILSEINVALMYSIDNFDFALGNKFSTYFTWAVKKNFLRFFPKRSLFTTPFYAEKDDEDNVLAYEERSPIERQEELNAAKKQLKILLKSVLSDKMREMVCQYYGLDQQKIDLPQIAKHWNTSDHSVQVRIHLAVNKLRQVALASDLRFFLGN